MEPELILRLFLIVLGIVFLILSFAGAILELARRADRREALRVNPVSYTHLTLPTSDLV